MTPEQVAALQWAIRAAEVEASYHKGQLQRLESLRTRNPATEARRIGAEHAYRTFETHRKALHELMQQLSNR